MTTWNEFAIRVTETENPVCSPEEWEECLQWSLHPVFLLHYWFASAGAKGNV